MGRLKTHKEFISDVTIKNKHVSGGDIFILGKYKSKDKKVLIKNKYGYGKMTPHSLLTGANLTILGALHPKKFIKEMFEEIHGRRYKYCLDDYTTARVKIKIECHRHGIFNKTPNKHLLGEGCPTCKIKEIAHYNRIFPKGWSTSSWKKKSDASKNYHGFKFYVVRLFNETENFIKVGRTYLEFYERAKHIPYKYEVLYISVNTAEQIVAKETFFKKSMEAFRHIPEKDFGGKYECFSIEGLPKIRETVLHQKYEQYKKGGCLSKYHCSYKMTWDEDKEDWLKIHEGFNLKNDL